MNPTNTVKPVRIRLVKVLICLEVALIIGLLIIKLITEPDIMNSQQNYQFAAGFFIVPFAIGAFVTGAVSLVATFYFMAKQRFTGVYLWFYGLEVLIWAYFAYLMALAQ